MVKTQGKKEVTNGLKLIPGTAPTAEQGLLYFDSATSSLKISNDGSNFVTAGGAYSSVNGLQALIARLNTDIIGGTGIITDQLDGSIRKVLYSQTDTTYADTTNSSVLFTEKGLVAWCDVLDKFDTGSSPDTNIWTFAETHSVFAAPTAVVSGGVLTISGGGSDAAGSPRSCTATLISNGTTGLNIHGQDTEVVFDLGLTASASGGGPPSASFKLQISNGTTHVDLVSVTVTAATTTDDWHWRLVYTHSSTLVTLYKIVNNVETVVASAVNVSTATTNKYIRIAFTASTTGAGSAPQGSFTSTFRGIGYRKNGATAGNADFVVGTTVASSTAALALIKFNSNVPTTPSSTLVSTDGGSSYGTQTAYLVWGLAPGAGTGLRVRFRAAKPTAISGAGFNIPIAYLYGLLYA